MGESVTGGFFQITTKATGNFGSSAPVGQRHTIRIDLRHDGNDEASRACIDALVDKIEAAAKACKMTVRITRHTDQTVPQGRNWA